MPARTVLLAGVATRLQVEDATLSAAIDDALGACPLVEAEPVLTIADTESAPALPGRAPDEEHQAVRLWRDGGRLVLSWGGVLVACADDRALVLGTTPSPHALRAVRQVVPYALAHLLGAMGKVVLHAGAVLDEHGRAVLVLGPTGAGKSTLVFAARAAGRPVLADDLVALSQDDDGLRVTGIPRPLAVAADDRDGLPADAIAIGDDVRGRWQFPLEGTGGAHPVGAVVVVEHSQDRDGHLEPLNATAVWDTLLGSFFSVTDPERLKLAFPVLGALSRRPGWRLGHGADPASRLTVAAALFDALGTAADG